MQGVMQGFAIVLILIGVGLATAKFLPGKRQAISTGLTPLIFYITNPALMFILLADADLGLVLGVFTPIALLTAAFTGALFAVVSRVCLKTPARHLPAAAMATSYVNAGNIGIPLALYAVGSTTPAVSVLIAQLLVIAPAYLCMFALISRKLNPETQDLPLGPTILKSIANPVTVATAIGACFSFFQFKLPEVLHAPLEMLGNASIPLLLMAFGMSLYGQKPLADKEGRPEVFLGVAFKVLIMPCVAWVLGRFVFGLESMELMGVVVMAALPTAQNVLLFSQQFSFKPTVPREVILASTFLSIPVALLATFLLS